MAEHNTTDSTIARGIVHMQYGNGTRFENVFHFAKTGVGADLVPLKTALVALVNGQWKLQLSYAINITQVTVENVLTGTQEIADLTATVGSSSAEPAPMALAIVVSLRSGQKQRWQNGRFYFGGWPKAWIGTDSYNGPTSGTMDTLLTDMATRFMGLTPSSTWNLGIFTKGKAPFGEGGIGWPKSCIDVQTLRWNKVFGTQRRRIPNHGS